jgi:hypothetical protein
MAVLLAVLGGWRLLSAAVTAASTMSTKLNSSDRQDHAQFSLAGPPFFIDSL